MRATNYLLHEITTIRGEKFRCRFRGLLVSNNHIPFTHVGSTVATRAWSLCSVSVMLFSVTIWRLNLAAIMDDDQHIHCIFK